MCSAAHPGENPKGSLEKQGFQTKSAHATFLPAHEGRHSSMWRCQGSVLMMSLPALVFVVLSPGLRSLVKQVPCQGVRLVGIPGEILLGLCAEFILWKVAPGGNGGGAAR